MAEREKKVLLNDFGTRLGLTEDSVTVDSNHAIPEAGNAVLIRTAFESGTSVFSEIGRPRLSAESVAKIAADEAAVFLEADVPVCRHLQDQLLVPMALSGCLLYTSAGSSLSSPRSMNIKGVRRFS